MKVYGRQPGSARAEAGKKDRPRGSGGRFCVAMAACGWQETFQKSQRYRIDEKVLFGLFILNLSV